MKVTLEPITKDNWEEAIVLTVKEEQKHFIASIYIRLQRSSFLKISRHQGYISKEKWQGLRCMELTPKTIIFGFIA